MKAIIYTRVSTAEQGKSGLGLQAQLDSVNEFCRAEDIDVIGHYQETETGKGFDAMDKRPELAKAMAHAKKVLTLLSPSWTGLVATWRSYRA